MIEICNDVVYGFWPAMRGMRNPMNSWSNGDTVSCPSESEGGCPLCHNAGECEGADDGCVAIGPKDRELAKKLAIAGSDHAKYRRMISVYADITAPLYWWKEFDTYKVGTVANSCSTMHTIADKEFTLDDFSYEHLIFDKDVPDSEYDSVADDQKWNELNDKYCGYVDSDFLDYNSFPGECFKYTIKFLNRARELYLKTGDQKYWWQMIQLLPSSYNQKRTVMMNYEVLANIYNSRRNHKLDEWRDFCKWIASLPYAEDIIIP